MTTKPIILDTDPGVDDALAIMLALGSQELDVMGICTVSGNVPPQHRHAQRTGIIATIGPHRHTRICGARDQPLKRDPVFATEVHGESGMGQARLPEPARDVKGHAVDFLIQTLSDQPGEITLIAVGPLTNLALAEQRQPGTLKKAKQVIVMGGAIAETGNSTPVAEFNFYADPHAAQIVVHSDAALLICTIRCNTSGHVLRIGYRKPNRPPENRRISIRRRCRAKHNRPLSTTRTRANRVPARSTRRRRGYRTRTPPLRNPVHRHRNIGRPHPGPGRHRPPRPAPALASRRTCRLRAARQCRSVFVPISDTGF